ncbi:hypothetical protein ANN_03083 [Periplaneta americana]|uniref:Uncharacterized protein n=1 Tax=Periplaneta americana TaxID=6978 RepID=A0ABQ8TY19_PERAM|nr:hypothetical protein ANN_03083 [Periplaneta americana]
MVRQSGNDQNPNDRSSQEFKEEDETICKNVAQRRWMASATSTRGGPTRGRNFASDRQVGLGRSSISRVSAIDLNRSQCWAIRVPSLKFHSIPLLAPTQANIRFLVNKFQRTENVADESHSDRSSMSEQTAKRIREAIEKGPQALSSRLSNQDLKNRILEASAANSGDMLTKVFRASFKHWTQCCEMDDGHVKLR